MARQGIQLKDKDGNRVYPLGMGYNYEFLMNFYTPVGFEFKTYDLDFDPNNVTSGTWVKFVDNQYDYIYYNSQEIMGDKFFTTTTAGTYNIIGAPNYKLIEGVFMGATPPAGYKRAYRLTAQLSCGYPNGGIEIALNNIVSDRINTGSYDSFMYITSTGIFAESAITLEPTMNRTSQQGINLKCIAYNPANTEGRWRNATIHGYWMSNKKINAWRRTA